MQHRKILAHFLCLHLVVSLTLGASLEKATFVEQKRSSDFNTSPMNSYFYRQVNGPEFTRNSAKTNKPSSLVKQKSSVAKFCQRSAGSGSIRLFHGSAQRHPRLAGTIAEGRQRGPHG